MIYIVSFLTSLEQHMQEKMTDLGFERGNQVAWYFRLICKASCSIVSHLRMAGDIGDAIKKYEELYEKLMAAQQNMGLASETPDRLADS